MLMFALTHIYCARKINPQADSLFLYGSIFPDIPVLGVIDWESMKDKTPSFSKFIAKQGGLSAFARGLTLHEEPFGIDRFVHGEAGYAYIRGNALHKMLKGSFPSGVVPTAAHSFIEFAVEMQVAQRFPDLFEEIKKVRLAATSAEKQIAEVFSEFFRLDKNESLAAVRKYNQSFVYDISTKHKAVDFYIGLLKILRSSDMPRSKTEELIDASLRETADCFSFLEGVIEKCRKDFI